MRFVLFYHSLVSDWNHGNAHFLRGIATELMARGHDVQVYEPENGWSRRCLLEEAGARAIEEFHQVYSGLTSTLYSLESLDLDSVLSGADVVVAHEWNDADLIHRLGRHRRLRNTNKLLFHDTHHRAISSPSAVPAGALRDYDGVLAYGRSLRDVYTSRGWARRAWTWHEAADVRVFRPIEGVERLGDLVWIGNWGDEERASELQEFLVRPARALGIRARVHGVRYPRAALEALAEAGIEYGGWIPNFRVPRVLAAYDMTLHIPRRYYVQALPGIPTIRPFEALACGIPLACSFWEDREELFSPRQDLMVASDGDHMTRIIESVLEDRAHAAEAAERGLATIRDLHTCAHRVEELLEICDSVPDPQRR